MQHGLNIRRGRKINPIHPGMNTRTTVQSDRGAGRSAVGNLMGQIIAIHLRMARRLDQLNDIVGERIGDVGFKRCLSGVEDFALRDAEG